MKISHLFPVALLALVNSGLTAQAQQHPSTHQYAVLVYVNTQADGFLGMTGYMDEPELFGSEDPRGRGIAHPGDLSLVLKNDSDKTLAKYPSDSAFPLFNVRKIVNTDQDSLEVKVILNDRDYLWVNPVSWFGVTNDTYLVATAAIASNERRSPLVEVRNQFNTVLYSITIDRLR